MAIADLDDHARIEGELAAADVLERQAVALDARARQLRDQADDFARQAADLRAEVSRIRRPDVFGPVKIIEPARKRYGSDDAYMMQRVADALAHFGEAITSAALAGHLAVGQARVRACLQRLEALGQVRRTGLARGTRWALISEDDQAAADAATVEALNGARTLEGLVRDACRDLECFTFEDLQAKLPDVSEQSLRRWLPKLERRGTLTSEALGSGKNSRTKLYEFVKGADMEGEYAQRRRHTAPEVEAVRQFNAAPARTRDSVVVGTGRGTRSGGKVVDELLREVRGFAHVQVERRAHKYSFRIDGLEVASCSSTPGASSLKQTRSDLRKAGVPVSG